MEMGHAGTAGLGFQLSLKLEPGAQWFLEFLGPRKCVLPCQTSCLQCSRLGLLEGQGRTVILGLRHWRGRALLVPQSTL